MQTRVAILTSGGDAPGMNAAIRAAVRTGIAHELEMFGVRHGYSGLIAGDFLRLGAREVGGIEGERRHRLVAATPLGRIGRPSDVSPVAVFLASRDARWVTGEVIFAAGGIQ